MGAVAWDVLLLACAPDAPAGCTDVANEGFPIGPVVLLVVAALAVLVGVLAIRARRRP